MTHPAYSLKVIAIPIKVDKLPVECPGERHIQSRVVGYLAGKHDAFANNDLHVVWPQRNPGGLCSKSQNIQGSEDRLLFTSDSAPGNCPSVPSTLLEECKEKYSILYGSISARLFSLVYDMVIWHITSLNPSRLLGSHCQAVDKRIWDT